MKIIIKKILQVDWRLYKRTVNQIQMEKYGYNIRFNESWYHITKINGMHEPHIHPNCSWCGVLYVQSGDEGSDTVFENYIVSTYR